MYGADQHGGLNLQVRFKCSGATSGKLTRPESSTYITGRRILYWKKRRIFMVLAIFPVLNK